MSPITDFPETSDEELVERVLQGESACFELLVRRYNQRLFRVARGIVGRDDEAEDVAQEAYVRAYGHLAQFEGRSRFSTWLTKIAVYEARARVRKQRNLAPLEEAPCVRERRESPEDQAMSHELREVLRIAVDSLPHRLREVFVFREVEGFSTAETAECLGLSPANVKVRLHRARATLRDEIDQQLGVETRQLYGFDGERCERLTRALLERIGARRSPFGPS